MEGARHAPRRGAGARRRPARFAALLLAFAVGAMPAPAQAALLPQPAETRSQPIPGAGAYCPIDLGAADALAWVRRDLRDGFERPQLVATSLASGGSTALEHGGALGACPVGAATSDGAALIATILPERHGADDSGRIAIAERPAGGPLRTAAALPGTRGSAPAIALAPGGAAAVAWLGLVQPPPGAPAWRRAVPMASVREAGGGFGAPVALSEPFTSYPVDVSDDGNDRDGVLGPEVGVDATGNVLVAWVAPPPDPDGPPPDGVPFTPQPPTLWAAVRSPGGALSAPRQLGSFWIGAMHLAVAPSGEAVLVLDGDDGVRIATGTAAAGLGTPTRVAGPVAGRSAVAIAPGGAAVVTWAQGGANARHGTAIDRVVAVDRPSGAAGFGAPARLATVARSKLEETPPTEVALAADGRALARWFTPARIRDGIVHARVDLTLGQVGGRWDRPVRTGSPCSILLDAHAAFGRDGSPRVTLLDSSAIVGETLYPVGSRVRVVRFGAAPPADRTPPRATIAAPRGQSQRDAAAGRVRLRLRCTERCDAHVFAIAGGKRGGPAELSPLILQLSARTPRSLVLRWPRATFDDSRSYREARRKKVRLVAHVCDAAGNVGRAATTVRVPVAPPRPVKLPPIDLPPEASKPPRDASR